MMNVGTECVVPKTISRFFAHFVTLRDCARCMTWFIFFASSSSSHCCRSIRTWKVKCSMKSKERSITDALENHIRFFFCSFSVVINCSMNTITNTQTINDAHMCSSHESIMKLKRSCRAKVSSLFQERKQLQQKRIHHLICMFPILYVVAFFSLFFFFPRFVKVFYVRAPSQYVSPSGVGTIKLSYTSNSAQPQTTVQYASTTPKVM